VDIGVGVAAFLPANCVAYEVVPHDPEERDRALDAYVGHEIEVRLLKLDRKARSIFVSRTAALRPERQRQHDELLRVLEVGQIRERTIKNILDAERAFVDLGGVDAHMACAALGCTEAELRAQLPIGRRLRFTIDFVNRDTGVVRVSLAT
jgi:ribosomal protein S1